LEIAMKKLLATAALSLAASMAFAQATPVGLWKTMDEETKAEKSLVRISETGGVLSGKIDKILTPGKGDSTCDKCEGARKDKPVQGMTIIEGAKKNAEEAFWDSGTILDPNNGKSYRLRLTPLEGGKQLQVRGYIGPVYRNQVWVRVE
jgi:uncharacterized protein (DUF2147 family)